MFKINARYIISIEEIIKSVNLNEEKNDRLIRDEVERFRAEPITESNMVDKERYKILWGDTSGIPHKSSMSSYLEDIESAKKKELASLKELLGLKDDWTDVISYKIKYLEWVEVITREFNEWEFEIVNDWNFNTWIKYESLESAVRPFI